MHNIYDIAKKAGVSIATVSRVLKGGANVKKETYDKVMQVIEELHYAPNNLARKLAFKDFSSSTFGVIIPDIAHIFYQEIVRNIYNILRKKNYNLFLFGIYFEETEKIIQYLLKENLSGLIFINIPLSEMNCNLLHKQNIPFCVLERPNPFCNSIYVDNYQGGALAAQYLLSKGYKKIAFIGETQNTWQQQQRLKGFKDFLCQHNPSVQIYEEYIDINPAIDYALHEETAKKITLKLYEQYNIDGFFFYCDELAYGGIKAQSLLKKKIGIIGYDDLPFSSFFNLTTIHQPIETMGAEAARQLLHLLHTKKGSHSYINIRLSPTLIIRNT